MKKKREPVIYACAIMRDEAARVPAWLAAVRPFARRILVADTGSEDATRALLKDGGLAVGKRTLTTGNKGSYFSWGGQSYGSYDAPDVETWTWFKLARTAAGDSEPPVIDAYVPGATSP